MTQGTKVMLMLGSLIAVAVGLVYLFGVIGAVVGVCLGSVAPALFKVDLYSKKRNKNNQDSW